MKFLKKNNLSYPKIALIGILLVGVVLRFYNLSWGSVYPFHPDERNMADAIFRFSPTNLDPHFYAYGQFPLYLAYFTTKIILSLVKKKAVNQLTFTQAILALRFWSAVFSAATIYFGYLISRRLFSESKSAKPRVANDLTALIAPLFIAFTPGLIQAAHFGTTESILAFSLLATTYYSLKILEYPKFKYFLLTAICLGIALGSKISAIVFVAPLILASFFQFLKSRGLKNKFVIFVFSVICLALSCFLGILSSPYLVLAFKESRGTLLYEISVAQGTSPVFYTNQFLQTVPILFQFQKIFPYALGKTIFVFGVFGLVISIISIVIGRLKKKKNPDIIFLTSVFVLLGTFFTYFFSQAFLFTKWTRFMTPIFAFFPIFAAVFISQINKMSFPRRLKTLLPLLITLGITPGLIFSLIYSMPDIRFVASEWIYNNIPSGNQVFFDTGNVIDIPILPPESDVLKKFPNYNLKRISFDFYHLDQSPDLFPKLIESLVNSDYIFVPSRRIFFNYQRFPNKFPKTAKYYQLLFSGQLGFKPVAEFKRFTDENAEETFTVFDHPVIRIYKKVVDYTEEEYEALFEQN